MISKFLKISFIALVTFAITSCNGNDDDGPAEAPSVQFRAFVNGVIFESDTATSVLSNEGTLYVITASNDIGSETFVLSIGSTDEGAPQIGQQSYDTTSETVPANISFTSGGQSYSTTMETSGVINLNSFDTSLNVIFGSFEGELSNVSSNTEIISVTSGVLTGIEITQE